MRLAKVVHSEKKKAPTLKLYFVTALNSFNLLHSAVYGGSATERAPAEAVAYSAEWQVLFEPVDELLVTLDRGFAFGAKQKSHPVPLRKGKKWLPAWVSKDTKGFSVSQVADNAIQNSLRVCVEMANAFAKNSEQLAHPCVAARGMFDAVARVAVALANRAIALHEGFLPLISCATADQRYNTAVYEHCGWFAALYEAAETPPVPHPLHLPAVPIREQREQTWRGLLQAVSEDLLLAVTLLRVKPIRELAAKHPMLALESFRLASPLPDDRTLKYYLANRLCQLEFAAYEAGFIVWGHVGASMRQVIHRALLYVSSPGSLLQAYCSCINGTSGCCSHVQCLCLVLMDCKYGIREKIWSRKHSEVHLQSSRPFATLSAMLQHQEHSAQRRGIPDAVPASCWWADSIGACDLFPIPVHPDAPTIDDKGIPGLLAILDGIRAASADYHCFWCQEANPQKFKTASRAVKHLQTKHSLLWKGLSPAHQAALLDSPAPDVWLDVALSLSIHPESEAGAELAAFIKQLRASVVHKQPRVPPSGLPAAAAAVAPLPAGLTASSACAAASHLPLLPVLPTAPARAVPVSLPVRTAPSAPPAPPAADAPPRAVSATPAHTAPAAAAAASKTASELPRPRPPSLLSSAQQSAHLPRARVPAASPLLDQSPEDAPAPLPGSGPQGRSAIRSGMPAGPKRHHRMSAEPKNPKRRPNPPQRLGD
jgi:hypothetical protein